MKKTIGIFLLSLLSFQLVLKTVWYVSFELNRNFFIERFCENADRPELNCRARCYLKKQAEEEHRQSKNIPGFIKEKASEQLPIVSSIFTSKLAEAALKHFPHYNCEYSYITISSVFQPPPPCSL